MMDLDRALEYVIDGHAVLFTGAGFAEGALNLRRSRFKKGRELAQHLAISSKLPDDTTLEDAAEEFAQHFGEDRLIEELQQEFTASNVDPSHIHVAELPWHRIYTTNYDNVLETAYRRASKQLTPVTLSDDIRQIPKGATLCIHLNGFVDRVARDNLWSELKLTDSSYLTASLANSSWATFFRQDISLARAVFLIGYSLADLDIRRLLFETPDLREKCFFILGPQPDSATVRRASRFGQILQLTTAAFMAAASSTIQSYKPPRRPEHVPYCVQPYEMPTNSPPFSDRDVFDLLLLGDLKSYLVSASLHGGPHYFLERAAVDSALNYLARGTRAIIIHSDLGNGKTLVLEGIKCRASEQGYQVFTLDRRSDTLLQELEQVLTASAKTLLVVDDYPNWLDTIEFLSVHANSQSAFVLAARSSANDVMIDRVCEKLGVSSVPEIPVDRLTDTEIQWLVNFFNEYGLWGEKASWSLHRKSTLLSQACRREFHAILLKVLESPQIVDRFEKIFQELNQKRSYHEVVLAILALTVLTYIPSLDVLVDLCGDRVLSSDFRRNPAIAQLIDFARAEVRLRSSIASQFILKRIANVGLIVEVLIGLARSANRAAPASAYHRDLMTALMRFSNLQDIFPEKGKRAAIIRYYEAIKGLDRCRKNPLFWLQYAIACLVLEELDRAEKYFETAYSLAEDRDYEPYQIDNHYARFLLVKAVRSGDPTTCMAAFRKARRIVIEQVRIERLHYPYRIAAAYGEFYDAFESTLSTSDKQEIARAALFIAKRIAALPEDRKKQKYVAECSDVMVYIIERVNIESVGGEDAT